MDKSLTLLHLSPNRGRLWNLPLAPWSSLRSFRGNSDYFRVGEQMRHVSTVTIVLNRLQKMDEGRDILAKGAKECIFFRRKGSTAHWARINERPNHRFISPLRKYSATINLKPQEPVLLRLPSIHTENDRISHSPMVPNGGTGPRRYVRRQYCLGFHAWLWYIQC